MILLGSVWAECKKELTMVRRYPFNLLMNVIIMYVVFLQMFYTNRTLGTGSGMLQDGMGISDYMAYLLVGLVFWNLAMRSMSDIGVSMSRDTMTGTIEHLLLSPSPSWMLLTGRAISSLIVTTVFLGLMCVPLYFMFSLSFHWNIPGMAFIFVLSLIGVQGFAYMLAGFQFLVKNIGGIIQLLNFVFLFMCGVITPWQLFPGPLRIISQCLPITFGLDSMRKLVLGNLSWNVYFTSGIFRIFLLQTIIYYILGITIYNVCMRIARKQGTLGNY